MWYESIQSGWSWESLWYGYARCSCGGLRRDGEVCGACKAPFTPPVETFLRSSVGGQTPIAPGGEGRYEDYIYLRMLEREWLRPLTDEDRFFGIIEQHRPSARAIVILTFWTYFETKIERLYRTAGSKLPPRVLEDFLRRHSSIGARLDRGYRVFFDTSYWDDLKAAGFPDVSDLLQRVHKCRNLFSHGHPEAIDDALVEALIIGLKREHEAWISTFNKRLNHFEERDA